MIARRKPPRTAGAPRPRAADARLTPSDRARMALAHSAWETRQFLLLYCRSHPQCLRMASALSQVADTLWPETVSKGKR